VLTLPAALLTALQNRPVKTVTSMEPGPRTRTQRYVAPQIAEAEIKLTDYGARRWNVVQSMKLVTGTRRYSFAF